MFGQSHFFTQSRFSALGGVNGELGRGGDTSRKHSKYSPPWVCEKCAKKHPSELGCDEASQRGLVIEPNDVEFDYVETTRDIDQALGHIHRTYEEMLGCDKCKRGKRRRKAAEAAAAEQAAAQASAFYNPYNLRGAPLSSGQGIRVANMGHTHVNRLGQQTQALMCPASPPDTSDPTLNCMRDARGNAVCSNGQFYPPGCPHTPPEQYFTPGISPDEVVGGILQAKIPPPRAAGSAGSSGSSSSDATSPGGVSTTTAVVAGAGALGIGAVLFFLFK